MTTPPAPAFPEIDANAFARDLDALRAEIDAGLSPADFEHLKKIERWGRLCSGAGYATAWLLPNPLSALLMSVGNTARWTMLMHHVGHRGYDRVPGTPPEYTSARFAEGPRRAVDWLDWMLPEAWRHEHNLLHHYRTNELEDPDLVEENLAWLRTSRLPTPLKYAVVGLNALTWKLTFYAPSTFQALERRRRQRAEPGSPKEGLPAASLLSSFDPTTASGREFWARCVLPYGLARFVAVPALFAPLGPWAVFSVLVNSLGAELLTNLHTFALVVPNHAGDDLYRFEGRTRGRAEFYVRQVVSSANYATGSDARDFLHGWLNYQIEHHLWPDLPMSTYQQIQPRVKALCAKHGVPYVQESVFRRVRKMVDVAVGATSMRVKAATPRRRAHAAGAVAEAAPAA